MGALAELVEGVCSCPMGKEERRRAVALIRRQLDAREVRRA